MQVIFIQNCAKKRAQLQAKLKGENLWTWTEEDTKTVK